jgi:transposase InsO family protein
MWYISNSFIYCSKYIYFFINDYNKRHGHIFLKEKNSTFENLKIFKVLVENGGEKINTLRTGKGGQYMSHEFSSLLEKHGIRKLLITTNSPH